VVPDDIRAELEQGARDLGIEIAKLKKDFEQDSTKLAEIPSVEIFHKAVDWALRYGEFFEAKQFDIARGQLQQGVARAKALRSGAIPWKYATGLVVRGYRSSIDGSVQPYGLVIPADWQAGDKNERPLHLWFHGRGEKLSELAFINDRQSNKGEFTPEGAIVLHLYGRYCNANKFAGEVDAFEAMREVAKNYPIDSQRVVIRGFSMGGASTWHMAMHYPGLWAAAAPGAGFSETQEFFKSFAPDKPALPWWEMVLWRWYDATICARNLAGLPLVAYSGEIDGQKQAADIMLRFAQEEGLSFPHVIGPQTPHKYHPDSKIEIERFISEALAKPRETKPRSIKFTTYSLLYPSRSWIMIERMEQQWERADIDVKFEGDTVDATTKNVAALRMECPASTTRVKLDGDELQISGKSAVFSRANGHWQMGDTVTGAKHAFVCGPIDHAFMSAFLHVRPTGKPLNEATGAWAQKEFEHATSEWRRVFRGDAPIRDDGSVTDDELKNNNIVLWGDPSSNAILKRFADKLPAKWSKETLEFRGYKLEAKHYVPIFIFPNPLNPQKYVVVNSGHTFRERAALNNSDQTPKLPDWAIVDVRQPADDLWPGLIYDAGFFSEIWK
jgi:pimeloyl-ACP methyl ester carboxylesterase